MLIVRLKESGIIILQVFLGKEGFMSINDGKHLSLEDRMHIETNIIQGKRKYETANEIQKSQSSIGKEIRKYRQRRYSQIDDSPWMCKHFNECKICISKCQSFEEIPCFRRDRFVGACNNCPSIKTCKKAKYFYYAKVAQKKYEYTLKDSRIGVNLNTTELYELAHIICPLIKQGQSIYTILQNHREITQCAKTIYTYIEMGLFKDWGITNIDLRRKVSRKITKKKKLKKRAEPADYTGRKYEDYTEFVKSNPCSPTTEMDTVYNNQDGPYIQTFIFENTGLMIGLLKQHKTVEEMSESLNYFQDILSPEMYEKLFGLLLTDRGNEFSKPQSFEINCQTGEIRSKIFYCDAQMPSQKPHVENNHEFIRDIIPKKTSMKNLTQEQLNLMFSHINSVPRKSLGGKTPYEAFEFFYGKDTLDKLNIQKIEKDKVTLQPYLLHLK